MTGSASSVLVCRGCCCGSEAKHPDLDHAGQVERLRAAAAAIGARCNTTDCLGPCERANVVVVRTGQERRWFGDLGDVEVEVLASWLGSTDPDPPEALAPFVFPGPSARVRRRLTPERGAELTAMVVELIAAPGTWTMGVPGAIAEFDTGSETAKVEREDQAGVTTITARTATGAMRLRVDSSTRLFAFGSEMAPEETDVQLLVRTGPGPIPSQGLTEIGLDPDPIEDRDGTALLFDLGLGRSASRFMVRTDDAHLIASLRRATGSPLSAIDESTWQALVAVSPTRVVETALGRVEVSTPIPLPGGVSPVECHTHLLPAVLAGDLDLPEGLDVPKGWQIGPLHYTHRAPDDRATVSRSPAAVRS